MGYVDLVDYDQKIGGGFMSRPYFKMWYKKGFLGIFYFMLVNGQVAWNMSCKIPGIIQNKLNNRMWRVCVADLMLQWNDPREVSYNSPCSSEIMLNMKNGIWGRNGKVIAQDA